MKKVLLVFVVSASIMALATVKAEGMINGDSAVKDIENAIVVEDVQVSADSVTYEFRIRLRDMNREMHLNVDQVEFLQHATSDLTRCIALLEFIPEEERQSRLAFIVAENLAAVRDMVDDNQYNAYLSILDNEFNKTGLNTILYGLNLLADK